MIQALLRKWPGKSAVLPGGVEHPAAYHMLDVAAVAEVLAAQLDLTDEARQAIVLLTALHDLGKIGNRFRDMIRGQAFQGAARHWQVSEALLRHHDHLLAPIFPPDRAALPAGVKSPAMAARQRIYAAVAGHHGRPPDGNDDALCRMVIAAGEDAIADSAALIDAFRDLWPGASLAGMDREAMHALGWWLPGFIAAADWIGSNTDWFAAAAPGPDLADYLNNARRIALTAVNSAGLAQPAVSDAALFDFSPRPMQAACAKADLPPGPTLAVIEDETGTGKTEAALILAQRMLLAGKGRGLFFALPTMATANAMFARASAVIGRMFEAPPSLTLAHGRAAQSSAYKDLLARQNAATDAPVCTEWLADNRRRALLANVGVGTVDQALLSVLPTRFATLRHFGLVSKILIVDEVHEMGAPYMAAELAQLLRAQRMAGGSAILLTATLPADLRARLIAAWGEADDGDLSYPALTIAGTPRKQVPATPSRRGSVAVRRLPDQQAAIATLANGAAAGAACLWVRNAVDDAIQAVHALRDQGIAADLLHARFALADRLRHEGTALGRFGKDGQGRQGRVLVATQVVESSLDLDFDVMVSDLAPVAALVQRAGRLWRHMDLRPAGTRAVPEPVLHVLSPDPAQVADETWLREVLDKGAWVYPLDLQWRTADALFRVGKIDAPHGLRALIESVHGATAVPVPAALQTAELTREGQGFAEADQARRNLIDLAKSYRDNPAADDTDYPTRLGRPTKTLLLARRGDGGLGSWAGGNDVDSCQLSEVTAAESRLRGVDLPDQGASEISIFTDSWQDWRRHGVTVCPVGDDGVICDGLRYDVDLGLLFE